MKERNRKQRWLTLIILLVVLLGIGFYLNWNRDLFTLLLGISWPLALSMVLLRLLFVALNGYYLKLFAQIFDVQLHVREWFGLAFITTMGNYLTPLSGGMVARATYLKVRHALPYTQFLSLLTASYLIIFWVAGVLGLVVAWQLKAVEQGRDIVVIFFVAMITAVSILFFLPPFHLPERWRLLRLFNAAMDGWQRIRTDRTLLIKLGMANLLGMVLNGLAFWFGFLALHIPVALPKAILISLSTVFSVVLTVTPGNLGVREAIVGLTGELIGVDGGEGLLVALLIRATTLTSVFVLGPLFSFLLSRELTLVEQAGASPLQD